jgi:IclR family transcriptional regulator, acetate operon repressor
MIESVRKAAGVLRVLATQPGGLGARELAARTGTSKSTAQRLLQTLESTDLVTQDARSRRYRLGPLVASLGLTYLADVDVRAAALPRMERLRDELGETVGLTVRLGDERIYIAQLESAALLAARAVPGKPYPMWSGAPGRVLLAGLPDGEIKRILTQARFTAFTEHTPVRATDVRTAIQRARADGLVEAFEETIAGVNTIAAPIHDSGGAVVAALSVSGPATRFGSTEMFRARHTLLTSTASISTELGAPRHPSRDLPGVPAPQTHDPLRGVAL